MKVKTVDRVSGAKTMRILHCTVASKNRWTNEPEDFGLAHFYLISYAKQHLPCLEGLDFRIAMDDPISEIEKYKPDVINLSIYSFNMPESYQVAKYAHNKGIYVIAGGQYISAVPDKISDEIDVAIIGEGEITYTQILVNLYNKKKENIYNIKGIAYHRNGKVVLNEPQQFLENLDEIGHIDRDITYFTKSMERSMYTSRGCPYKCNFCLSCVQWKNTIRYYSPKFVIEEIEKIYEFSQTNFIKIEDLIFTSNKIWLRELLELWKRHYLYGKIKFSASGRSNNIDEEMAELLADFGIDTLFIGFESADDKILKYYNKTGVTEETHQKAIDLLLEKGITVLGGFMVGCPIETKDSMQKTIDFVKRNKKLVGYLFNLDPMPGTYIGKYAEENNLINKQYIDYIGGYNVEHIMDNHYIHMCSGLTKEDIISYFKEFNEIMNNRPKSQYVHKSKFR